MAEMKIAIISMYLPSGSKIGVGYQVHYLANKLVKRGHKVTVFSQTGPSEDSLYEVVVVPGNVSMDEGRTYVAAFDVGLIPFLPGHIGDAINPVKIYMYLMAGKPVVSTWVRECRHHVPLVYAAKDTIEFISAIRKAAGENDAAHIDERIEFALQNTWEKRAQTALSHLKANGLF